MRVAMARAATLLMTARIRLGLPLHGLSVEVIERTGRNLVERAGGATAFRFLARPAVATVEATPDGACRYRAPDTFHPAEAVRVAGRLGLAPYGGR